MRLVPLMASIRNYVAYVAYEAYEADVAYEAYGYEAHKAYVAYVAYVAYMSSMWLMAYAACAKHRDTSSSTLHPRIFHRPRASLYETENNS
jgi:hypothetical protein